MYYETVVDLSEIVADWLGVFGSNPCPWVTRENCDLSKQVCANRPCFIAKFETRMRAVVKREKMFEKLRIIEDTSLEGIS